eukprot:4038833-Amphidinium_carterae.1
MTALGWLRLTNNQLVAWTLAQFGCGKIDRPLCIVSRISGPVLQPEALWSRPLRMLNIVEKIEWHATDKSVGAADIASSSDEQIQWCFYDLGEGIGQFLNTALCRETACEELSQKAVYSGKKGGSKRPIHTSRQVPLIGYLSAGKVFIALLLPGMITVARHPSCFGAWVLLWWEPCSARYNHEIDLVESGICLYNSDSSSYQIERSLLSRRELCAPCLSVPSRCIGALLERCSRLILTSAMHLAFTASGARAGNFGPWVGTVLYQLGSWPWIVRCYACLENIFVPALCVVQSVTEFAKKQIPTKVITTKT